MKIYNISDLEKKEEQPEEEPVNLVDETTLPIMKKKWKMYTVFGILIILLIAVSVKLFKIQIIDRAYYKKIASIQHQSKVPLIASRGNIYDRNGVLLATNIESFSFAADPSELKEPRLIDSIASEIAKVSIYKKEDIISKIKNSKGSFVWLLRGIDPSKAYKLSKLKINGFIVKSEPRRNYLFSNYGSQIIGCTDIDNKGLAGLELSLDSILNGKDGYMIMNKDASGRLRPLADLPKVEPIHGKSIQLTIDIVLQRIVEYELKNGVVSSGAESGTVVAIDPTSGEILAMASYPNFNPNDLTSISNSDLKIRAITELYEPGSTFKMITASAAIEEDIIHPDDMVDGHNGALQFKDFTIIDDHPIGQVTFREAFAKSSNIVLSTIAYNIPDTKFYKYIRDFGFGIKNGIELPGEVTGRLKKIEDFDASARRFAGYGYGIAVTPLQLANAYSAVANLGVMYRPHIISKVFDGYGNVLKEFEPQKVRRIVSNETAIKVKDLLTEVVEKGTGINAKINGLTIAGKTGTAQQLVDGSYKNKKYTASFAGFFPAENPKLALVVILDKPQGNFYGGSIAAPIFRNIAQRWVSIMPNIMPEVHKQQAQTTDSIRVPLLKGISYNDAKRIINSLGLKIYPEKAKNEIVLKQDPGQGTYVYSSDIVTVSFEQPDSLSNNIPDLRGLSFRRAINILHKFKMKAILKGEGIVTRYELINKAGEKYYILYGS